eukprot:5058172-Pyramimonas_sp.AAC.1
MRHARGSSSTLLGAAPPPSREGGGGRDAEEDPLESPADLRVHMLGPGPRRAAQLECCRCLCRSTGK